MTNFTDAADLLVQIATCRIAKEELETSGKHQQCSKIIHVQGAASWLDFQVPEPWSGHLSSAPLLFLSSNPSISLTEKYPKGNWSATELGSYFENRFDGYWVKNGNRALQVSCLEYGDAVGYWSNVRNRAKELFGRDPVAGQDYVLSEIVHCKSIGESGVRQAIRCCGGRYLAPMLRIARARLIVLVGKKTLEMWNELQDAKLRPEEKREGTPPIDIEGQTRVLLYMPHPAGGERGPKRFVDRMSETRLAALKQFLKSENC
jgi:uracil-DNA glycosylase